MCARVGVSTIRVVVAHQVGIVRPDTSRRRDRPPQAECEDGEVGQPRKIEHHIRESYARLWHVVFGGHDGLDPHITEAEDHTARRATAEAAERRDECLRKRAEICPRYA